MLKDIKIEYIYHSGFSLSFEDKTFVFDYYKGKLPDLNKDTSFFVTHSHEDHYNPEIFNLPDSQSYTYILSNDLLNYDKKDNIIMLSSQEKIESLKNPHGDRTYYVGENDQVSVNDFSLKTFGSTDKGVSMLLTYKGIRIFHAGDLNLWVWDEDTEEERKKMYDDFTEIVDKVSKYGVDIAFFPLDPRLEDRYADGFNIFVDKVKPSIIFPMHFKDQISYNLQYMSEFKDRSQIFRPIFKENQFFLVNYEDRQ